MPIEKFKHLNLIHCDKIKYAHQWLILSYRKTLPKLMSKINFLFCLYALTFTIQLLKII